ncbi:MAG: L-2-amino-thiazoline-4-carboxylic acid hydrolase, partial [Anaerolineaceae bacterium]|nr:L-2-amino-thiazoline-4-carboxylic acid hydrolase [Anaerolineaceae bacterium]
ISDEHLQQIIRKIAMAKVMAGMLGMEKAAALRNRLSQKISVLVFEEMFAPAEVFIACGNGDFLPPFRQYYTALMDAMAAKGLEEAEVVIDEADDFQLNVTWCAWAEAARLMGDPYYCYYSTCYGDEVFFPHFCKEAGFTFERKSTLALGAPVCDFRFTRKSD